MKKPRMYNVLIVYTDGVATSASSKENHANYPFSKKSEREKYNECYAFFLEQCKNKKLKAGLTTSRDLTKNGIFKSCWEFRNKKWIKVKKNCYAPLIFDKFSPINDVQEKRHSELFGTDGIEPFNSVRISRLFSDKQKTHDILTKFSIPTVTIRNDSETSIKKAVDALAILVDKHPDSKDFSKRIVVKNRFGAGGNNIFCTEKNNRKRLIKKILRDNKELSFILQPFAKFKTGYANNNYSGFIDIRLIYLGQNLIQSYIRTSARGDFRCNTHQGGDIKYIEENDIPPGIKEMAIEILKAIKSRKSLLALDFIISNNGNIYLMEGNSHPGVTWDSLIEGDMENTKRLILAVIDELGVRSNTNKEHFFPKQHQFY